MLVTPLLVPVLAIPILVLIYTPWWSMKMGNQDGASWYGVKKRTAQQCQPLLNGVNSQVSSATMVSKAHSDLHFQKMITLVASSNSRDPLARIWKKAKDPPAVESIKEDLDCLAKSAVRAWQLQGFSLANIVVLERYDGWVLIDAAESTGTSYDALQTLNETISSSESCTEPQPGRTRFVTHLLISHHHTDHIGGFKGIEKWNQGFKAKVIVHEKTNKAILDFYMAVVKSKFKRAVKQFGSGLEGDTMPKISAGIGASYSLDIDDPPDLLYPTHSWKGQTTTLSLEPDFSVELIYMPGETEDQVCFFVEKLGLFHFSDNFYFSFPNVYPLRGGPYRSPLVWKESLDLFLTRYWPRTRVITVGHTSAVFGNNAIRYIVERYRDALAFIHHQTVRLLDKTSNLDVIADHVNTLFWATFPSFEITRMLGDTDDEELDENLNRATLSNMLTDPLMPYYGQLEWAVKAIGTAEFGWFDENPSTLNAHRLTPLERSNKFNQFLLALHNSTLEYEKSTSSLISEYIKRGECQWALELVELISSVRGHHHISEPVPISQCPKGDTDAHILDLLGQAANRSVQERTGIELADEVIKQIALGEDLVDQDMALLDPANSTDDYKAIIGEADFDTDMQEPVSEEAGSEEMLPPATPYSPKVQNNIQKHTLLEKVIRDQWKQTHCTGIDDTYEMTPTSFVPSHTDDYSETMNCLRKKCLWCLADVEISSSGRNWFLSEAEGSEMDSNRKSLMMHMRNTVVEGVSDFDPVMFGLSFRYVPFGNKRDPKETFIFFLTFGPDLESIHRPKQAKLQEEKLEGFSNVLPLESQTVTYEVLYRNQVFNVRKITDAHQIDWYSVLHYKSFAINLKWSGIKAIFLRKESAPRLILSGKARLPSEYPVPVIALQEANENLEIRSKVHKVFEEKGKLGITERIKMFILFTEIMLSLESK